MMPDGRQGADAMSDGLKSRSMIQSAPDAQPAKKSSRSSRRPVSGSIDAENPVSERQYSAPPIIDAVIELRFEEPVSEAIRESASKKLAAKYPVHEELTSQQVEVQFQATSIATHASIQDRFTRRSSTDINGIVIVGSQILAVATGAPYPGWDTLFARLKEDWSIAKRAWKYRKLTRLGVRYVNRIDLSVDSKGIVEYEDFLALRISLPDAFPPINGYELAFQFALTELKCGATVRSGIAPPAVPGMTSFTLDVDVWRVLDVPQKESEVFEVLSDMRAAKNELFETFITDRAREMFDAV